MKKKYTIMSLVLTLCLFLGVASAMPGADAAGEEQNRAVPTALEMTGCTYYPSGNSTTIDWKADAAMCDGYQVAIDAISGNGGGVGYVTNAQIGSFRVTLPKHQFFKVRVRGYLQHRTRHEFGAWSSYRYVATMPEVKFEKVTGVAIKATWTKVKGVSKYEVLVGRESDGKDAVLSATLSSKKTTATVDHMGAAPFEKDSKPYYVFIKPYAKVSKKTVASDVTAVSKPISFYSYDE